MKTCTKGHDNEDSLKFCGECGEPFFVGAWQCSKGHAVAAAQGFCGQCGERFDDRPSPGPFNRSVPREPAERLGWPSVDYTLHHTERSAVEMELADAFSGVERVFKHYPDGEPYRKAFLRRQAFCMVDGDPNQLWAKAEYRKNNQRTHVFVAAELTPLPEGTDIDWGVWAKGLIVDWHTPRDMLGPACAAEGLPIQPTE